MDTKHNLSYRPNQLNEPGRYNGVHGILEEWGIGGPNQPMVSIVCIVPSGEGLSVPVDCLSNIRTFFYKPIEIVLVIQEDNPFQYACDTLIKTQSSSIRMELCSKSATIPSMVNIGLRSTNGMYITVQSIHMISHPLRFLYQTNPFSIGFNVKTNRNSEPVSVTVCKVPATNGCGYGGNTDGMVLSPSTVCMKRDVVFKIGLVLDNSLCDSVEMCMWEYLWRYVLFSDTELDRRLLGRYKRLSSNKALREKSQADILTKIIQNEIPSVECMDISVYRCIPPQNTHVTDRHVSYRDVPSYEHDEVCYTELFSREPDPIPVPEFADTGCNTGVFPIEISYLDKVMSIMNYGPIVSKITIVYVITNKQEYATTFRSFQESFRLLKGCSVIVCVTPAVPMKWVKEHPVLPNPPVYNSGSDTKNDWDITYVGVDNPPHAYSMVFSKGYLSTPYAFFLQDTYRFKTERILYPLYYLLEFMDRSIGVWNSIRFSSGDASPADEGGSGVKLGYEGCGEVPVHKTISITDDPILIRARIASMFLQPYITCVTSGDGISVAKQLSDKYHSPPIRTKLKMGVYEIPGYPRCCVDLRNDKFCC